MKPQENATDLIKKFGSESLNILDETLDIWEAKLKYAKRDNHERGIRICLSTIDYWKNIKEIIKNKINNGLDRPNQAERTAE